jgi:hypothetical protein
MDPSTNSEGELAPEVGVPDLVALCRGWRSHTVSGPLGFDQEQGDLSGERSMGCRRIAEHEWGGAWLRRSRSRLKSRSIALHFR